MIKDGNKIWVWLFLDIYLPSIIMAIARGMLTITLPLYLISAGLDPVYVGLGSASISLGNLLLDIPGGVILRITGEKTFTRISMILVSLSSLGMVFLQHPWILIMLSIAFGGGRSMWLLARRYVITYYVDYQYRGRASSFIGMSERLGTFIGPGIVALVIDRLGYPWVFLTCFTLTLVASIFNIAASRITMPRDRIYDDRREMRQRNHAQDHAAGSNQPGLLSLAAFSAAQIAVQGVRSSRNLLITIIGKGIGMSDSSVSLAVSISGALDVLSSYPAGVIMDKKGRHVAVMISFSIMAIGFLLLAITNNETLFYASVLTIGFGNGFGSGTMITMGADIVSSMRSDRGAIFLSIWQFIGDLGSTIFPVSIGLAVSIWGASASSAAMSAISTSIAIAFKTAINNKILKTHHRA
ncbi:MAG TPA: MFS transporter [Sulfolobales archaeon]|nr:MFS transporter [Sulfolobales archaeon]